MELPKLPLVLSYTSLNHYLTCPKRFYHMYIRRDAQDRKTFAQSAGIQVHDAIRKRLKLREPLPESMRNYEAPCASIERLPGAKHYEIRMGIDAQGAACEADAPACRFQGTGDVVIVNEPTAFVLDWKNGKPWEEPLELRTLAMLTRARFRNVKQVNGSFYWLRTNTMGPVHPVINDVQRTWSDLLGWANSIAGRIARNDWPADENKLCAWCSVSKAQCHHRKDPPS